MNVLTTNDPSLPINSHSCLSVWQSDSNGFHKVERFNEAGWGVVQGGVICCHNKLAAGLPTKSDRLTEPEAKKVQEVCFASCQRFKKQVKTRLIPRCYRVPQSSKLPVQS